MTGTAFDLTFRVFCPWDRGNASDIRAGCARAPIGPSTPSGLARTASQGITAKERSFRLTLGSSALRRIRHAGIPCINRPLVTAFLRPEGWSKELCIATCVKIFLSRTSPAWAAYGSMHLCGDGPRLAMRQTQRRFTNVRTGSRPALQLGRVKVRSPPDPDVGRMQWLAGNDRGQ